ncbi:hypothetical protein BC332_21123 [Capsicum chinense]|nr:hypothetical protein BC332_21123 [Capsicum chinense]
MDYPLMVLRYLAHHIHSMVDESKSLGDTSSYEDLYMFKKMVQDQGSYCLRYVHETDRIHVSADYRRYEATHNVQSTLEVDQATNNYDFGSTSRDCTQEFTQASDILDATKNLENLSTTMEDYELDDVNNEVNHNDLENVLKVVIRLVSMSTVVFLASIRYESGGAIPVTPLSLAGVLLRSWTGTADVLRQLRYSSSLPQAYP